MSMSSHETGSNHLAKGLDVLDLVAVGEGVTMRDLVERLELPRSTLQRILATLASRHLIRRDGRIYRATDHFRTWGRPDRYARMKDRHGGLLEKLRDRHNEAFILAVVEAQRVRFVDWREGNNAVRVSPDALRPQALPETAVGRLYLGTLFAEAKATKGRHAEAMLAAGRTGVGCNLAETNRDVVIAAMWAERPSPAAAILAIAVPAFRAGPERMGELLTSARAEIEARSPEALPPIHIGVALAGLDARLRQLSGGVQS